ncbi:MAG: VPDSG-CTERM sorting domain-containing protein, partial [Opitutaceae bacterium]
RLHLLIPPMKRFPRLPLVLSMLLAAHWGHAAATAFASRTAFDTTFSAALIENWDSYPAGTTVANGSALNGITYNSSAGVAIVTSAFLPSTAPNALGRTPTGFFFPTDTITFTFGTPILAFGIDISTAETSGAVFQLTTNTGEVTNSVFDPFPGFRFGQFAGFSSNVAFTSVTVSSSSVAFGHALDTLRYVPSQAVPDGAATSILLGFAIFVLLALRRRLA